jgi:hypothetical protein
MHRTIPRTMALRRPFFHASRFAGFEIRACLFPGWAGRAMEFMLDLGLGLEPVLDLVLVLVLVLVLGLVLELVLVGFTARFPVGFRGGARLHLACFPIENGKYLRGHD